MAAVLSPLLLIHNFPEIIVYLKSYPQVGAMSENFSIFAIWEGKIFVFSPAKRPNNNNMTNSFVCMGFGCLAGLMGSLIF